MDKDCERFQKLVSDRLDGEISPPDQKALEAHLGQCEECRRFEESTGWSRERLRSLPDIADDRPPVPPSERADSPGRFWGRRVSLPMPVAAALAVLLLAGWLLEFWPSSEPANPSPARPALVQSVEIIRVQPARVMSVSPGDDDSSQTKEAGI